MKIRIALQATKNKVPCEQTRVVIIRLTPLSTVFYVYLYSGGQFYWFEETVLKM